MQSVLDSFFTLYMSYSLACVSKEKLLVCSFCNLVKTTGTHFYFWISKSRSNITTMHYIIKLSSFNKLLYHNLFKLSFHARWNGWVDDYHDYTSCPLVVSAPALAWVNAGDRSTRMTTIFQNNFDYKNIIQVINVSTKWLVENFLLSAHCKACLINQSMRLS